MTKRKNNMLKMKPTWQSLLCVLVAVFTGCDDSVEIIDVNQNQIRYVVSDNFSLGFYEKTLRLTGLAGVLMQEGPYTLLAPSDLAYQKREIYQDDNLLDFDRQLLRDMAEYHILEGRYDLSQTPFVFNQEVKSVNGGKLFVTHWVKEGDTILTINGSPVNPIQQEASNGLVQTVDHLLEPYRHDDIRLAIASEAQLTLFHQALQQSGILDQLNKTGNYSIFAPTNEAMRAAGYSSQEDIVQRDPKQLKDFVQLHMLSVRRFTHDFFLTAAEGQQQIEQSSLNNKKLTIKLLFEDWFVPNGFSSISLRGEGNMSDIRLARQDILTGNGVLHIINGTLQDF